MSSMQRLNEVQNQLIIKNQRLAFKYVNRFLLRNPRHFFIKNDLYQAALFGIVKAAYKFDSSKNVLFSTFAHSQIMGSIKDELHKYRKSHDIVQNEKILGLLPDSGSTDRGALVKDLIIKKIGISQFRKVCLQSTSKIQVDVDIVSVLKLKHQNGSSIRELEKEFKINKSKIHRLLKAA
jgi:RNA polymerase sigma factor (sigma-70 family)